MLEGFNDDKQISIAEKEQIKTKEIIDVDFSIDTSPKINPNTNKDKIYISQSLIKLIIDKFQIEKEFCPKYIYDLYIAKTKSSIPSENMIRGLYFETALLGATSGENGVYDLPRKLLSKKKIAELTSLGLPIIGEKRLSHIRIDNQIERAKMRFSDLELNILPNINTQIKILKNWNDRYILSGVLDIFPTTINQILKENGNIFTINRLAIVDLKLTGDIYCTSGPFGWGNFKHMDHLQADMYHYLVEDIDFELNPHLKNLITEPILNIIKNKQLLFLYWVFGYKEPLEKQDKIFEKEYNNHDIRELKERIRKTIAVLEREEQFGWQPKNCDMCFKCPNNMHIGGNCHLSIICKI
jgi:hypothetical protein